MRRNPTESSTTVVRESPLVSIITVNYNGARYLPVLLEALAAQTYPRFEVHVVDNGSTDDSIALLERDFPWVKITRASENLGFAGGNNLGIARARGAFFALINNDTVPDPDWLRHLVAAALESPQIAGVGSKILFARPFLPVRLEAQGSDGVPVSPPADDARSGIFLSNLSAFAGCSYRKPVFDAGFHGPPELDGQRGGWIADRATIFLPVESLESPGTLELRLSAPSVPEPPRLAVSIGDTEIGRIQVAPSWQDHRFPVPPELGRRAGFDLINNAASFLKPDGAAGDRGIFQPDRGQYDSPEDVEALCGCAMLLSRQALEQAGAFDRDFFMYFEDSELSWRLRKRGFRLRYQPKSVVRHFHASTTVEWSPLFNFHVARNRILMLIKHAAPLVVLRAYLAELAVLLHLLRAYRSLRHVEVRTRLKIQLSLVRNAPRALLKRLGLLAH
ncbi:MAG: glycosyltransferase family 2 protein [Vicinamibacteraceae bacterium]